jgi:arylsulfatase A-like enzyme
MGGKATRDFANNQHPSIQPVDYTGPRAIIDGRYKLIIHDTDGSVRRELFDLAADPGEKSDLANQQPDLVAGMAKKLEQWQQSVLNSLMANDY